MRTNKLLSAVAICTLTLLGTRLAHAAGSFQVITTSLPQATVGSPYGATISFLYSGTGLPAADMLSLPSGVSLNSAVTPGINGLDDLTLSGIPTQSGTSNVTLLLTDNSGAISSQQYALVVNPVPQQYSITTQSLPAGTVGVLYNANIGVTYSGTAHTQVTTNTLPQGLSISSQTLTTIAPGQVGVNISGVPTQSGSFSLNLTLSNTLTSVSTTFSLSIAPSGQGGSVLALPTNMPSAAPVPTPTPEPTSPPAGSTSGTHPAGTNVSSNGTVYMVAPNGQLRPYTSAGAFLSYGFNSWTGVVQASSADLSLPQGSFIPPRDGKIVCSNKGTDLGTCYLITDGQKAAFTSAAVFTGLGFSFSNTLSGDVSFLPSAANVSSSTSAHLPGTLINRSGTIYLVGDSGLLGVPNPTTLTSWGYSFSDAVAGNAADASAVQVSVMATHTAGALSPLS